MSSQSTLYLFPVPIADNDLNSIPVFNKKLLSQIKYFVVERVRTARRFLKLVDKQIDIDSITFIEMDKHNNYENTEEFKTWLNDGVDIGLMSESGVPCIGDPGNHFVTLAQNLDANVVPLVGPSSIILSLMASGLNGQNFQFEGYLPVKEPALRTRLSQIEKDILRIDKTHIFIEAPYRAKKLFDYILKNGSKQLRLCVAIEIDGPKASIRTKQIGQWKEQDLKNEKQNVIFLLGK